jgi:hypothetical protein
MPVINFANPTRDSATVSAHTRKVLSDILKKAGINQVTITSAGRTANDQARIMYDNITRHGVAHQKKLYGTYGDQVIDEYSSLKAGGKTPDQIRQGITNKINQIGPGKVSKHAADPGKLNVVDIAPSSINLALRKKFEQAVSQDNRVSRFLTPPGDPAYHLEIPQP